VRSWYIWRKQISEIENLGVKAIISNMIEENCSELNSLKDGNQKDSL